MKMNKWQKEQQKQNKDFLNENLTYCACKSSMKHYELCKRDEDIARHQARKSKHNERRI